MLVLGIDTATVVAGTAIINDDKVIAERFVNNKLTHSQNLMPMVDQVLKDAGVGPRDLKGLAVSIGPGSFTGLRIGLAAAKGMAQVLGIPLVGVPTLDILTYNLAGVPGLICPILDARKQQVYTAVYRSGGQEGRLIPSLCPVKLTDYLALSLDELVDTLMGYDEQVTFLGDGVAPYRAQLEEKLDNRASFASPINNLPRGSGVALLGFDKLRAGEGRDWLFLEPAYVRRSEAEVTWEKKNCCQVEE
ncbi:MAG: tRNA (adenosine(37)-N6)-threonylcarbamoyltransferase complex dimerization subunit type 1 TsaB [Clostridia bacterium]|nr:tRNA (adenosine(37)-N6)-threonylcarbamoyltransferase complex dimerization subunit type 1 TsaB [Clostridia bacterium]